MPEVGSSEPATPAVAAPKVPRCCCTGPWRPEPRDPRLQPWDPKFDVTHELDCGCGIVDVFQSSWTTLEPKNGNLSFFLGGLKSQNIHIHFKRTTVTLLIHAVFFGGRICLEYRLCFVAAGALEMSTKKQTGPNLQVSNANLGPKLVGMKFVLRTWYCYESHLTFWSVTWHFGRRIISFQFLKNHIFCLLFVSCQLTRIIIKNWQIISESALLFVVWNSDCFQLSDVLNRSFLNGHSLISFFEVCLCVCVWVCLELVTFQRLKL